MGVEGHRPGRAGCSDLAEDHRIGARKLHQPGRHPARLEHLDDLFRRLPGTAMVAGNVRNRKQVDKLLHDGVLVLLAPFPRGSSRRAGLRRPDCGDGKQR